MGKKRMSQNFTTTKWSSDYGFISNDYNWINKSNEKDFVLHSLLVSAPFLQLEDDLEVFAELSGYKDLGFDLLVQREYDEERIELDIVKNFLNVKGKLHFFPPLTVALIPTIYGEDAETLSAEITFKNPSEESFGSVMFNIGNGLLQETIFWQEETIEELQKAFNESIDNYPFLKHNIGNLRWDKAAFNAVIIDGQHRYLALKKYIKNFTLNPLHCQIPINFITLIPKPGKEIDFSNLVETARELFIDINKNAQKVSEPRQILLDDRDLKMYISRSSIRQFNKLYADKFFDWRQSIFSNIRYLNRIPQEIVSWNMELSPNDNENSTKLANNQITSTTLIYRIFKEFILNPTSAESIYDTFFRVLDLTDFAPTTEIEKDIFARIISKKNAYIAEERDINEERKAKEENHYEIYDKSEYPFNSEIFDRKLYSLENKAFDFDRDVNDWISKWFFDESVYGKFITRFYTSFSPYQELLSILEPVFAKDKLQENRHIIDLLIDPKSRPSFYDNLNSLPDENKQMYRELWGQLESLKSTNTEIRNIIFQKSVLSNLFHLFEVLQEIAPQASWDERIDKYISSLNILYQKNIFERNSISINYTASEFLGTVSEGKYGLKTIKIWDGIMNDVNSGILYKDSDAPKIGHLIIIMTCSIYNPALTFDELTKGALSKSVLKVRDSLRTFYLNKVKLDKSYNTQQDVWNSIFTHSKNKEILNEECVGVIKKIVELARS
jgi:hypothetical protein